jgi:PAS domain S-box-containing protein
LHTIYKILFSSINEGLIIADSDSNIVDANPRSHELFGYAENELIGLKINELIPMKARERHTAYMANYYNVPTNRGMGGGMTFSAMRKDGSDFSVEISLNHFESNGQMRVAALITDVSERAEQESKILALNDNLEKKVNLRTREVIESHELYSAIARNFPKGTINVIDLNLNYIFVEGRELHQAGITSEKLIGTNYLDRMPKEIQSQIKKALLNVFNGNKEDFELKHEGSFYNINAVPLTTSDNKIDRLLLIERNITEQKLVQQHQQEALDKEKKLNDMKSRFVSMASHEFRTPLSTVLSSVSLIEKYIEREEYDNTLKHTQRIRNSVKGLTDILNDFLSVDKLENQKAEIKSVLFNYNDFCHDLAQEIMAICKKDQNLKYNINSDDPMINTDPNIVRNILYNLMSNAIKYSKEGGEIIFNSEILNSKLTILIQDFGIGIPETEQKQLFSRFFRAANASNIEGTGLGLHIVKKYLDILGGKITFESTENEGTKFILTIPMNN